MEREDGYIYKDDCLYNIANRRKYLCIVDRIKIPRNMRLAWFNEMVKQKKMEFIGEF